MMIPALAAAAMAATTPPAQSEGRKFALIIGIDTYEDPGVKALEGCVNDAKHIRKVLIEKCGFPVGNIVTYVTEGRDRSRWPTEENLRRGALGKLRACAGGKFGPQDTVVVYYAGHAVELGNVGYFVPWDAQIEPKEYRGADIGQIGFDASKGPAPVVKLQAQTPDDMKLVSPTGIMAVAGLGAGNVIGIFDMCRNEPWKMESLAFQNMRGIFSDGIFKGLNPRTLPSVVGSVVGAAKPKFSMFYGCQSGSQSIEASKDGTTRGQFSLALERGLGGAADTNKDSVVTLSELQGYVKKAVKAETGGQQDPYVLLDDTSDFVLAGSASGGAPSAPPEPIDVSAPIMAPEPPPLALTPGVYQAIIAGRWTDLVSSEGGYTIRMPVKLIDPSEMERMEQETTIAKLKTKAVGYFYQNQERYRYYRFQAVHFDHPKPNPKHKKVLDMEKEVLEWAKKSLAENKEGNPFLEGLPEGELTKNLLGGILNLLGVNPGSIFDNIFKNPFGGNKPKADPTVHSYARPYPLGIKPGFRIEWRKENEGYGIIQIIAVRNRAYMISEVYQGGDQSLADGITPRSFVDSFDLFKEMIDKPETVMPAIGG